MNGTAREGRIIQWTFQMIAALLMVASIMAALTLTPYAWFGLVAILGMVPPIDGWFERRIAQLAG